MLGPAVTRAAGCRADCNGCAHRTLSAQASETQKVDWLAGALMPWRECLAPIRAVSGIRRWAYRDRVTLTARWAVDGDVRGEWRIGLMRRDEVIDIRDCPVHSVRVQKSLAALLRVLPAATHFPLAFYVQAGAQITQVLCQGDNAGFSLSACVCGKALFRRLGGPKSRKSNAVRGRRQASPSGATGKPSCGVTLS